MPDCWTVHPDAVRVGIVDYAEPEPQPAPFTIVGWRLVHLAACKIMYHEYAFGRGQLTWDRLALPQTAATAIAWLEEGHARLQAALERLDDSDLAQPRFTNWGELWPTWRLFWALINHDLHHGAEIGCLRALYLAMKPRMEGDMDGPPADIRRRRP